VLCACFYRLASAGCRCVRLSVCLWCAVSACVAGFALCGAVGVCRCCAGCVSVGCVRCGYRCAFINKNKGLQ